MPVQPALLPNKTSNTITVRATSPVMDVIERVIRANDKPRAEVIIDVQILEVEQETDQAARPQPEQLLARTDVLAGSRARPTPRAAAETSASTNPPPFNLNTISQGVSTADFYLSVPAAIVRFLEHGLAHEADCQAAAARRGRARSSR